MNSETNCSRTRRLILASPLAVLVPTFAFGQQNSPSTWFIEGRRFVVDNCPIGCPCVLGEVPTNHGMCEFFSIYHVDSGNYRGVDLSNTRFGLAGAWVLATRDDKPRFTFTSYYLDTNATPEQIAAHREIVSGPAFAARGKAVEVKELPIEITNLEGFGKVEETCRGTIGKIGALEVTVIPSPRSFDPTKPLTIANPAGHPNSRLFYVGRSSNSYYESAGKRWRFHNSAGESMDFRHQGA
jgi:hypothetical protein